jgi:integrase
MATVDWKHPKETSKGTAYRVRWTDPNDRDREKWVYGKKAAREHAAKLTTELAEGSYIDRKKGRTALEDVAAEWIGSLTKPKPDTVREYRRLLDTRVLPELGARRAVGTVKESDVSGYVNGLRAEGLRPGTIERYYHPLRALLRYAVRKNYLPRSPAADVELPDAQTLEVEDFAPTFLRWPEVERLAAEAAARAPVYGLLVRFVALTGLRAAEVAGLHIGDVAILGPNATVHVRRTRSRKKRNGKTVWVTTVPKSKRSSRTVPILDPALAADLAAYLAAHPRRAEPDAPLFYGRRRGGGLGATFDPALPWDSATFYRRIYKPAATRARIALKPALDASGAAKLTKDGNAVYVSALRFHDLRHTAASLWANAGVEFIKVSRWLGHESSAITDRLYAHLFRLDLDRESARFVEFLTAQRDAATAEAAKVTQLRRIEHAG